MKQVGRNDPCPCGSGLKYKKCCMQRESVAPQAVAARPMPAAVQPAGDNEAIQTALEHQRAGRLTQATAIYQKILSKSPNHPDVLHYMGMAAHEIGEDAVAVDLIGRALRIAPGYAEAHNNLGNIFFGQDNFEEAAASYRRAIAVEPEYVDAQCNLGGVLFRQGKIEGALAAFERALTVEPENGMALHMIAAMRGMPVERAPREYVANLFNAYAGKFDEDLAQRLGYDIPQRLVELASAHAPESAEKWDVLDLGCGTGMVGARIAPHARQLVGVDLSSRMLEKARQRAVYTRLVEADLLAMLLDEPAASYDVVTAADVFIYVGRIDEVVAAIRRVLKFGGLFAFSVETPASDEEKEPPEVRLAATARFAHSPAYIARLAAAHGLQVVENLPARIRLENGVPVPGFIALWKNVGR